MVMRERERERERSHDRERWFCEKNKETTGRLAVIICGSFAEIEAITVYL